MILSEKDHTLAGILRWHRVLQDLEGHKLPQSGGGIIVPCPDCDQYQDIFKCHADLMRSQCPTTRLHPLSLNGGGLLIASESPLHPLGEDLILLNQIAQARELKGINTVVLYAHAPCGAAYTAGLNITDVLDLLLKGKKRVKKEIPGIVVACFCHIDWGNGRKRTYFVSRPHWEEWQVSAPDLYPQSMPGYR